jgi:6-phosphogluconolactonase (cycloisomerase 2 family)
VRPSSATDAFARRLRLAAVLAVASLAIAGDALGATGDLRFVGCDEDDADLEGLVCANAPALLGSERAVVSADGTSVYVISPSGETIVHFARDTSTGELGFQSCVEDDDTDDEASCPGVPGLDGVRDIELSADGKSAYAVSDRDDAIVHFARDTTTGALTFLVCGEDDDTDHEAACAGLPGLDGAAEIASSADGTSVYVVSWADDAFVHFARNTSDGGLTFLGCGEDDDTDNEAVCAGVPALAGPRDIELSANGASAYVASGLDDAFVHFARDTSNGALGFVGCVEDDDMDREAACPGVPGLNGAKEIALSADGSSAYAASAADEAIVHFERDTTSGAVGFQSCIDNDDTDHEAACPDVRGLDGVREIGLSADGASAYAAAPSDGVIVHLTRDTGSGALGFESCVDDEDSDSEGETCAGIPVLDGASDIALSADGRSAYVTSNQRAIVHFVREPPALPRGTPPGGGGAGAPPGGSRAPLAFGAKTRVTLALAARRIPARGPLKVRVRNANAFRVASRLSGQLARKRRVKLTARSFSVAAKSRKTVTLRLPRTLRRQLKRKGKLALRLTAKVADPAGNTRTVRKRVTPKLKRRR